MKKTIGIVMDSIESITPYKDTTLLLLLAAQTRGWKIMYMEQNDLYLDNNIPTAGMVELEVQDDDAKWFSKGNIKFQPLSNLNVILMRKDPPFNTEYIYTTYILEAAEKLGVMVINKPQSLRDYNEKIFSTLFPQCIPPLVVSSDLEKIKKFVNTHGETILKPLDGMGGSSIFKVSNSDPNLNVIIETLTCKETKTIMAQKFIPDIIKGDKRILMIEGEPIPYCLARIPPKGDTRGNLAVGGKGIVQALDDRDLWIASQVGGFLKEKGIILAGLDVIGSYLTEINITSPTCAREIEREKSIDIGGKLFDVIERYL
jgi:glutathione synthase|tara:strand:+ start:26015 stop:26959 length:945 start_codon:yes stop_codon:yes gene_type:complete